MRLFCALLSYFTNRHPLQMRMNSSKCPTTICGLSPGGQNAQGEVRAGVVVDGGL